jgi:hypothetical protein
MAKGSETMNWLEISFLIKGVIKNGKYWK